MRYTCAVPSPYLRRFMFGFRNEIRGCTRGGTAKVRRRYGEGPLQTAQMMRQGQGGTCGRATLGPPLPSLQNRCPSVDLCNILNTCVCVGKGRCGSWEGTGILLREWANFLNSFAGHLVVCMGVATFAPICRGCGGLTGEMGEWLKPTVC